MSEPGYSVEGLRNGIERCKHNVKVLQGAIEAERKTIADYKIMISHLEEAKEKQEEAEANVHVEVVEDGNGVSQ